MININILQYIKLNKLKKNCISSFDEITKTYKNIIFEKIENLSRKQKYKYWMKKK